MANNSSSSKWHKMIENALEFLNIFIFNLIQSMFYWEKIPIHKRQYIHVFVLYYATFTQYLNRRLEKYVISVCIEMSKTHSKFRLRKTYYVKQSYIHSKKSNITWITIAFQHKKFYKQCKKNLTDYYSSL